MKTSSLMIAACILLLAGGYWRRRAELGTGSEMFRITAFTDAAWTGPRNTFTGGRVLHSVGVGVSYFDGLFRVDIARPLDGVQRKLRVSITLNAIM
jgi:hypothetical protein